ncbi:MAG: CotH kinase family protein [Opitutales bacterium]
MLNSYTSVFLRSSFDWTDPVETGMILQATLAVDDGAIVWINGAEVVRFNMREAGEPRYDSLAWWADNPIEPITFTVRNAEAFVHEGRNEVAVQLFNATIDSSDIYLDLLLEIFPPDLSAPAVVSVNPEPGGEVAVFEELIVSFSKAVIGVDAADLRINGRPATGLENLGNNQYRFRFPQPEPGAVEVTWRENHGISDWNVPSVAFDAEQALDVWSFQRVDQQPPEIESIHPAPGATIAQLTFVDVSFTEPVAGLMRGDLRLNGFDALSLSGSGEGPYRFTFSSPPDGAVRLSWAAETAIRDLAPAPNAFSPSGWSYVKDAAAPGFGGLVQLNEFVASNASGLSDEAGGFPDWIEIANRSESAVNLLGWSLSDDRSRPDKWVFPEVILDAGEFLVVYASGEDAPPLDQRTRLHADFKLSASGEYLGLFSPDSSRRLIDGISPGFPEQRTDVSYGRNAGGDWVYFSEPTPGEENAGASYAALATPVVFSREHGFFSDPFILTLHSEIPGAKIRYTLDGSTTTTAIGIDYDPAEGILIDRNRVVRATAFADGYLSTEPRTESYFLGLEPVFSLLPVVSLVTDEHHLRGPEGILGIEGGEYVPRGSNFVWQPVDEENDYHNPQERGREWERPVSAEWIFPDGKSGFSVSAGIRVHGSSWMRPKLRSDSKFSFRLYFRGAYGEKRLEYPLFGDSKVTSFDKLVLRAGHNDSVNPFITDEMVRRLFGETGHVTAMGTFAHLFLNGEYQGYYNITERIDGEFLRDWNSSEQLFDIIKPFRGVDEGDGETWAEMMDYLDGRDLSEPVNYHQVASHLDIENFIDYLLVNLYSDTRDWTLANWRAAREKMPDGRFRYLVWDAEFALGIYGSSPERNSLTNPDELGKRTDISIKFDALKTSPEFRLRFADRVHKHFFNGAALSDENIRAVYGELRDIMGPVIPSFQTHIGDRWIPNRRAALFEHLEEAGLMASATAPVFSQHGKAASAGFPLEMAAQGGGMIFFTINGQDPRTAFSGTIADSAVVYDPSAPPRLSGAVRVKARTLRNGEWSALTEAVFDASLPSPHNLAEGPYIFDRWDMNSPAGTYPAHMRFDQVQQRDPGLSVETDGYWTLPYNLTNRSRIKGLGANGISFLNTSNAQAVEGAGYLGSARLLLNTLGRETVRVEWTAGTVTPNNRTYALRLQYRVGAAGSFADVADELGKPVEYVRNPVSGHAEVIGPTLLPEETWNQPHVELRWKYYYVHGDSGARAELRLDNIRVTSSQRERPLSFDSWQEVAFPDPIVRGDPALSGPFADPAGERVPNLLRYALDIPFGALPEQAQPEIENGKLILRFRRNPAKTDIAYIVEAASRLSDWHEVIYDSRVSSVPNNAGDFMRVADSKTLSEAAPYRFLRLRVVLLDSE